MIPFRKKTLSAFADNLGGALVAPATFGTLIVPKRIRRSLLSVTIPHLKKGSAFSTRGNRSNWLFEVFHRHRSDEDAGARFAQLYRDAFREHRSHRKAVIIAESLLAQLKQTGEVGMKAFVRKKDSLGRDNCYQDGTHVACAAPGTAKKEALPKKKETAKKAHKPLKAPAEAPKPEVSAPTKTEPPVSDKAARAKTSAKRVGKEIQRYAEEYNEPEIAKLIKGWPLPNSEPQDLENDEHLVELKTMVDNDNDKITMDSYSQIRKVTKQIETGKNFHTLVLDDRLVYNANGEGRHDVSKRVFLYRRGVAGSARVEGLLQVKSGKELLKLMNTPDDELPDAAKRRDGKHFEGAWEFFEDGQGKGYKNDTTGKIFRAKK